MREKYAEHADFYTIYIREAHPVDGWRMESNDRAGVAVPKARSLSERFDAATSFCSSRDVAMPVLIDTLADEVSETYSGFPDRLYIIDRDGKIAYKGGRGPMGFDPEGMERSLVLLLIEDSLRSF